MVVACIQIPCCDNGMWVRVNMHRHSLLCTPPALRYRLRFVNAAPTRPYLIKIKDAQGL